MLLERGSCSFCVSGRSVGHKSSFALLIVCGIGRKKSTSRTDVPSAKGWRIACTEGAEEVSARTLELS
jgi:hypothetical protein